MAMAVTNKKAVLDSLKLTADKLTKLEKLVLNLKPSTHRPAQNVQPSPTSANSRGLFQLRATIKHKWVTGGFCSTHGWGISAGHSSANCKGKRPGHVDSATRTNPQAPATLHCLHTQPPDRTTPWSTVPGTYTAPQPPTTSQSLSLSPPPATLTGALWPPPPHHTEALPKSQTPPSLTPVPANIYFTPDTLVTNVNPMAPTSTVTDAAGAQHHSSAHADHLLPTFPACSGKIRPSFKHTLFGVGPLCDNGYQVLFDSASVTIYDKTNDSVLLQGWRKPTGSKLWCFLLLPDNNTFHHVPPPTHSVTPSALSATNLPSVGALVHYLHAAAGFHVKSIWLAAIKASNYASWPGLTYANTTRHCPDSTKTIKRHLTQTHKGICSTKPKSMHPLRVPPPSTLPSPAPSHKLHVVVEPVSKLDTNDMGQFPTHSHSGNQYIMLAYHCDSNAILVEPFQSCLDLHRIAAHGQIMARPPCQTPNPRQRGQQGRPPRHLAGMEGPLPTSSPNVHRANTTEQAIRTFKAPFLSILAGIDPAFPNYLWDKLLPQTELILNLLRQSTLAPAISAWESFNRPLNYDTTPLGPIGCPVIIHNKASTGKSWDFRGQDGFSIGPSVHQYRCFKVVDSVTNCVTISDTVKFRHSYLKQPAIIYDDRLLHAINYLSSAIADAPASSLDSQLQAITALRNLFAKWATMPTASPPAPPPLQQPAPPAQAPAEPHTTSSSTPTMAIATTCFHSSASASRYHTAAKPHANCPTHPLATLPPDANCD
eukprot:CCRYP_009194-RA/>CCRYP_009194-RA protein AED:0.39 eAED:0.16 QI:0/0/0/0.66/0.5/0.33/3/0/764